MKNITRQCKSSFITQTKLLGGQTVGVRVQMNTEWWWWYGEGSSEHLSRAHYVLDSVLNIFGKDDLIKQSLKNLLDKCFYKHLFNRCGDSGKGI